MGPAGVRGNTVMHDMMAGLCAGEGVGRGRGGEWGKGHGPEISISMAHTGYALIHTHKQVHAHNTSHPYTQSATDWMTEQKVVRVHATLLNIADGIASPPGSFHFNPIKTLYTKHLRHLRSQTPKRGVILKICNKEPAWSVDLNFTSLS